MPFVDYIAADRVRNLREDRGLSVEGLAKAIKLAGNADQWGQVHGAVDAFTLRRVEREGHCPSERVRLVLALFFGIDRRDLWNPANRRPIETATAAPVDAA